MQKSFLTLVLLVASLSMTAQLKVNSNGRVIIADTTHSASSSNLRVGYYSDFTSSTKNYGIAVSPTHNAYKTNIGVESILLPVSAYTTDSNIGVRGLVGPSTSSTHGRHIGVSGVFNGLGLSYGGAGIYGSSTYAGYIQTPNFQGKYAGYFDGTVYISTGMTVPQVNTTSDIRLKENVVSVGETEKDNSQTLNNILGLNVLEYNLKQKDDNPLSEETYAELQKEHPEVLEELEKRKEEYESKRHFGLSAQELQTVYPNLVEKGSDGYLTVNYIELVPLLIQSIQELKLELDEVKNSGESASMSRRTSTNVKQGVSKSGNVLYQNTPNPFTAQTEIRFCLSEGAQNAYIYIFDMTGKTLKQIPVTPQQESVTVQGYELNSGIYLYSLVVNGQEIDTKRMILSK